MTLKERAASAVEKINEQLQDLHNVWQKGSASEVSDKIDRWYPPKNIHFCTICDTQIKRPAKTCKHCGSEVLWVTGGGVTFPERRYDQK